MRRATTWMAAAVVAALAGLAGCDGGSTAQGGDPDVQAPGYAQEEERGTILNDTAPARPGAPSVIPGEGAAEEAERDEAVPRVVEP